MLAAGFAALSQWQLARSVSTGTVVHRATETVVPLTSIAAPQRPVTDGQNARMVVVDGVWVARDFTLVGQRLNKGVLGYWVVGHLHTSSDAGLAVAVGWSKSRAAALASMHALKGSASSAPARVTGRYLVSEAAEDSDYQHDRLTTVSTAQLVNVWRPDAAGMYSGYVVDAAAASGLTVIDSPKPTSQVELNWLNIFYAVEWVVFAGFAIFLWYRLVRDAWEREQEPEVD